MELFGGHVSSELAGFVLTLALSLLIGLEREETQANSDPVHFGGIRTFPIIGLGGFSLTVAFPNDAIPFTAGLLVLGALLAVSYHTSIRHDPGLTTEFAAVMTFTLGALAAAQQYWIATAAGVVAVILLQEKRRLQFIASTLPRGELRVLVRFLVLTGVILPVVPNHEFTPFLINPFKIWLVVAAVSGVSYASYLLRQLWGERRALLLAGILGGAYSSTVTTVALARQSKTADASASIGYAGAILAATGVMYIRLWILVWFFAPLMAGHLTVLFWSLGATAIIVGALLTRLVSGDAAATSDQHNERPRRNPLELTSAFGFAGLFTAVLVATRLVSGRFGNTGVLVMAVIMGAADVDPFILGLTQTVGVAVELQTAALAVVVAAATNNLMKGIYAALFGARGVGRLALPLLIVVGAVSIVLFLAL